MTFDWKAIFIRVLRTFIEGFLAVIPATWSTGIDWVMALETAGYAAFIGFLMALLTGLPESNISDTVTK